LKHAQVNVMSIVVEIDGFKNKRYPLK
jgi:hypothetical protein